MDTATFCVKECTHSSGKLTHKKNGSHFDNKLFIHVLSYAITGILCILVSQMVSKKKHYITMYNHNGVS